MVAMGFNKFQLKLLSRSGELLRCINCFAGQITVLRAVSIADLQPFQRFLAGVAGPEKMVATIDALEYSPANAALVGFGESFAPDIDIAGFFENEGLQSSGLEMILRNFGIDSPATAICAQLTVDIQKRLRLIAAINSTDKVIVLNNPFQDIASEWRERFAEELALQTRSKNRIVLVPSLQYRPECWIDNNLIARVQVGENRQRTIGFGSSPTEMNSLVEQLRSAMKKDGDIDEILQSAVEKHQPSAAKTADAASPPPAQGSGGSHAAEKKASASKRPPKRFISTFFHLLFSLQPRTRIALIACTVILAVGLNGLLIYIKTPKTQIATADRQASNPERPAEKAVTVARAKTPASKVSEPAPFEVNPPQLSKKISLPKPEALPEDFGLKQPAADANKADDPQSEASDRINLATRLLKTQKPRSTGKVLDLYPTSVRNSIMIAFNSRTNTAPSHIHLGNNTTTTAPTRKKDDFFALLQATSDTGKDLPPTVDASTKARRTSTRRSSNRGSTPISTLSREEIEERRRKIRAKFLEAIEKRAREKGQ